MPNPTTGNAFFNNDRHPFVEWYASLWGKGAAACQGKDIVLDDFGARRFGLGVDEGGVPVLAILEADKDKLLSIRWSGAAFIRNHKGRDWIALSAKDARVEDAEAAEPVPLRLWIPAPYGVLDAWSEIAPRGLRVRLMKVKGDMPVCPDAPPVLTLPLTTKSLG